MKRGISFALPVAGTLLVCMAACLNRPLATAPNDIQGRDTVRYYNEHGIMFHHYTKASSPANYVIRTCKTHQQLFPEWHSRDSSQPMDDKYDLADIHPITEREAWLVEALIRRERYDDPKVMKGTVPILDKKTIGAMLRNIKDSRWNLNESTDFCEYGGIVKTDSSLTCWKGDITDPCSPKNKGLCVSDTGGIADYHSHPSGEKDGLNKGKPVRCSFVQAPSLQDQQVVKRNRSGYVFGMNERSHLIYVYDSTGILATLPIDYLEFD